MTISASAIRPKRSLPQTVFVVFVYSDDDHEWQTEYVAEGASEADDHEADILSRTGSRTCVVRYSLAKASP